MRFRLAIESSSFRSNRFLRANSKPEPSRAWTRTFETRGTISVLGFSTTRLFTILVSMATKSSDAGVKRRKLLTPPVPATTTTTMINKTTKAEISRNTRSPIGFVVSTSSSSSSSFSSESSTIILREASSGGSSSSKGDSTNCFVQSSFSKLEL